MSLRRAAQWFLVSLGSNIEEWQAGFAWAHAMLAPVAMGPVIHNQDRYGGPLAYWNQLLVIPAQALPSSAAIVQYCGARQSGLMPLDIDELAGQSGAVWSVDGWQWHHRRLPISADVALGLEALWPAHYQATPQQQAQLIGIHEWQPAPYESCLERNANKGNEWQNE